MYDFYIVTKWKSMLKYMIDTVWQVERMIKMRMQYDLSAVEILNILGYNKSVGKPFLETIKQKYQISLPKRYCDFMEIAWHCPMLETCDVWVMNDFMKTFYEQVQEMIKDQTWYWEKNPETREGEFYKLSQIPVEQWAAHIPNLFLIGSDYAAGVVTFGIRMKDVAKDDPKMYWQTEGNDLSTWYADKNLSDFLFEAVLHVVSGIDYGVPEDELEENGFKVEEYFDAKQFDYAATKAVVARYGIDFAQLKKCEINQQQVFCCYDTEKDIFYVGHLEEHFITFYAITKKDADNVFDTDEE